VPTGNCRLCLQVRELQDSHLLPSSVYKKTRGSGEGSQHPYMLSAEGARQNSRQVSDYLLCRDCEHRFNVRGERYVMSLVKSKQGFPLQEMLRASNATHPKVTMNTAGYSVIDSPAIDRNKLAYFAASVFWRAAVHTWRNDDGTTFRNRLGKYEEPFRQYLLGAAFPENAVLTVFACSDRNSQETFFMPAFRRVEEHFGHGFNCRGIHFVMNVGKIIPKEIRRFGMVGHEEQLILVTDCFAHEMWRIER
jgi:hypothetical protein